MSLKQQDSFDNIKDIFKDNEVTQKEIDETLVTLKGLEKKGLSDTLSDLNKFLRANLVEDVLVNGIKLKGKSGVDSFLKLYYKVNGNSDERINTSTLNNNDTYTIKKQKGRILIYSGEYIKEVVIEEESNNEKLGLLDKIDNPFDDNELHTSKNDSEVEINDIEAKKLEEENNKLKLLIKTKIDSIKSKTGVSLFNGKDLSFENLDDESFLSYYTGIDTLFNKIYRLYLFADKADSIPIYLNIELKKAYNYLTKNENKIIEEYKKIIIDINKEDNVAKRKLSELLGVNINNIESSLRNIENNIHLLYKKLSNKGILYSFEDTASANEPISGPHLSEYGIFPDFFKTNTVNTVYFYEITSDIDGIEGQYIDIPVMTNKDNTNMHNLYTIIKLKKFDNNLFKALLSNNQLKVEKIFESKIAGKREVGLKNISIVEYLQSLNGYDLGYKGVELFWKYGELNMHFHPSPPFLDRYIETPEYYFEGGKMKVKNPESLKYVEGPNRQKEMKKLIAKYLKEVQIEAKEYYNN